MIPNVIWLLMLAVFSGLSMNLILQFGLGLKGIALDANAGRQWLPSGAIILCITTIFLWLFFTFIRSVLFLGLFEYVVLFPASYLVFTILEYFFNRFIRKNGKSKGETFPLSNSCAGAVFAGAALFMTLNTADSFSEALSLSFGFSCGTALVFIAAGEIRRRAEMEAVPRWLRGAPLALIAMGLLSLVFSSGALMLFGVLGVK